MVIFSTVVLEFRLFDSFLVEAKEVILRDILSPLGFQCVAIEPDSETVRQ